MALPIEFFTLVFRKADIAASFPGGLDAFLKLCDAPTFLEDDHLVRMSFMGLSDVDAVLNLIDSARPADELRYAVVQIGIDRSQVPAWLATDDTSSYVWLAETVPGPIVEPPGYFGAYFTPIPLASFNDALRTRGVGLEMHSNESEVHEVTFLRGSTFVDAWLVADEQQYMRGLITQAPRGRRINLGEHQQLIADLEAVVRDLGWDGSK